jgi:hypothetical protein
MQLKRLALSPAVQGYSPYIFMAMVLNQRDNYTLHTSSHMFEVKRLLIRLPKLFPVSEKPNKGKGKVVLVLLTQHHAMKAYWGSRGIAP